MGTNNLTNHVQSVSHNASFQNFGNGVSMPYSWYCGIRTMIIMVQQQNARLCNQFLHLLLDCSWAKFPPEPIKGSPLD